MGGELPPPLPPRAPILLILLSLAAGSGGEKFNLQDLLSEEQHCCLGDPWPFPQQQQAVPVTLPGSLGGSPSTLKPELEVGSSSIWESKIICMDTKIVYNWSVSTSGPHRALCADNEDCSSRLWPHKLKRGDVAFLYHPCTHPVLRRQLALLARACLPHHVLAPHSGLTREQPLALVGWGAALHMAKVELAPAVAWLKRDACRRHLRHPWRGWFVPAREVCPVDRVQVLQRLFQCWEDRILGKQKAPERQRQALGVPPQRPRRHASRSRRNAAQGSIAPPLPAKAQTEDSLHPAEPSGGLLLPRDISGPSRPALPSWEAAAPKPECKCPDTSNAQEPQQKEVTGQQAGARRGPTQRTEEAAWAASALTFLLVVLTLAVLYTRLHQNCRRSRSLYWTASGEEGQETVAAILKRRLLPAQGRRKKRSQRQQQRPLLPTVSRDSSE
ncbi:tumor protein p53-inducible protein 13 [Hemicordylus capensis]|uniref:tumor protein p53-inducible protein 13 n=1 Tax=Hemicordylus capensis TaxID=884348 RepID=UPI002304A5E8|nr:tumor protein p53-inducible protein 13 [Hemicordylus capensis]